MRNPNPRTILKRGLIAILLIISLFLVTGALASPIPDSPGSITGPGAFITILTPNLTVSCISVTDYLAPAISKYPSCPSNIVSNQKRVYSNSAGYVWPIGTDITGGYRGFNFTPKKDEPYAGKHHLAQDFKAAEGDQVFAIADGTVIEANPFVGDFGGEGIRGGGIKILHSGTDGKQFIALYAHVKEFLVKTNDNVKKGQVIAKIGPYVDKKWGSIPHLHFGINTAQYPYSVGWEGYNYSLGTWTDPMIFLRTG
jgi:murein DD-endopeptidase MepM/ murein hydrolase activator NlpD